jgi:hypothetical protein
MSYFLQLFLTYWIFPLMTQYSVDLPVPNQLRWADKQKYQVVMAVQQGYLSLKDASLRYKLSVDELLSWCGRYRH